MKGEASGHSLGTTHVCVEPFQKGKVGRGVLLKHVAAVTFYQLHMGKPGVL